MIGAVNVGYRTSASYMKHPYEFGAKSIAHALGVDANIRRLGRNLSPRIHQGFTETLHHTHQQAQENASEVEGIGLGLQIGYLPPEIVVEHQLSGMVVFGYVMKEKFFCGTGAFPVSAHILDQVSNTGLAFCDVSKDVVKETLQGKVFDGEEMTNRRRLTEIISEVVKQTMRGQNNIDVPWKHTW